MRKVLDADQIRRAMVRISHEIIERNKGLEDVGIVGIRTGGACLARRVVDLLNVIEKKEVPIGIIDIALYRDDLKEIGSQPAFKGTEIDFDIHDKNIVLVDDVLYTGRTIRCALDQLIDLGRPKSIQLAVLVDRGHRELPIRADYVGKNLPTQRNEEVLVHLIEQEGSDEVLVREKPNKEK